MKTRIPAMSIIRVIFFFGLISVYLTSCDRVSDSHQSFYDTKDSLIIEHLLNNSDTNLNKRKALECNEKAGQLIDLQLKNGRCTKGLLAHLARCLNNKGVFESEGVAKQTNQFVFFYKALGVTALSECVATTASIHNNLGFNYYERGEIDLALHHYSLALSYYSLTNKNEEQAYVHSNMGQLLMRLNDTSAAIATYQKAINIASGYTAAPMQQIICAGLNSIGSIYFDQKKYDLSLNYHRRALAIRRSLKDVYNEVLSYCNIGFIYDGMLKVDSADFYLKKACSMADSLEDKRLILHTTKKMLEFCKKRGISRNILVLERKLQEHQSLGKLENEPQITATAKTDTFYLNAIRDAYRDSLLLQMKK